MDLKPELPPDLDAAYAHVRSHVCEQIDRHARVRRRRYKWWALIYSVALVSFGAGILLPLLIPDRSTLFGLSGAEAGYAALATTGLLVLADQVFTVSSSYARMRISELRLLEILYRLEFDWCQYRVSTQANVDQNRAWQLLREAKLAAHADLRAQTETWMEERERGRSAFSSSTGSRPLSAPGSASGSRT